MSEQMNPANEPQKTVAERKRVPMSVPMRKLEVNELPGYHLHWIKGTPQRLAQAQNAGYEFVLEEEVQVNNLDLGGDASIRGNTDLGTRVSTAAGDDVGGDGQPVRLYLMKIKEEWWQESQQVLADRSEKIADAFRSGLTGADKDKPGDSQRRYVKGKVPDLFNPNKRRPVSA